MEPNKLLESDIVVPTNAVIPSSSSIAASLSDSDDDFDKPDDDNAIGAEESKTADPEENVNQSDAIHVSIRKTTRLSMTKAVESTDTNPIGGSAVADTILKKEVSTNKLNISSHVLVGRDKEKSILKECYQRLCQSDEPTEESGATSVIVANELIFIEGYSGMGKSVLARTIQEDMGLQSKAIYVEGKYEFTTTDEPYSGLSHAFGELCNKFKNCTTEIREKISSSMKENMKEEASMLIGMIPEITVFLDADDDALSTSGRSASSGREHETMKYAFRMFTRILGSHFSPIVIMLDDIQWADISSLDIIDFLISDIQNPHPLMIIGCYRSNDVDENSILYNRIRTLDEKSQKGGFHLTSIKVENFNLDSVNKMIMSMMSIDDESETKTLAEVCLKRTLGNPFFLIEFMKMLQTEALIKWNVEMMKWTWDADEIENATMSTANVVDLLKARMAKLSEDAQLLLQYAACIGASFSIKILKFIWSQHACVRLVRKTDDIERMLEMIQEVNMVEPCGPDELRWVHDKVQEAALSLSDLITPAFECGLGLFLYQGLQAAQMDQHLFDVTDLVNKGDADGRLDVAVLNFRAAKKARKMAAPASAAKYAQFGIRQLPPNEMFSLHRQLTLQLYSLGAEMEYALGRIEKAEEYIELILARDEYNTMETLPLKKLKAKILATAHLKWHEAYNYGLVILKDLGFNIVWNKSLISVQMLMNVKKLAKKVKKITVKDVERMNVIKDKKQIAVIDILKLMKHLTYNANSLPLCFLCICKVIETTLDHGISLCSAECFATFGGILMFLYKDHAAASHVCDLAFAFQKRSGRRHIADTMHCAWAFVLVQTKPLKYGLDLTMEGYAEGLRDGDPLDSTNCLINRFVLLPYVMGRPLVSILETFPKIGPQLEESGITNNILTLKVWWQMMVNLQMTPSEAAKKLEGEHFRQSEETAESNMYVGNVNLAIGELLLYFGDHEERAKRLLGEEEGKTYSELVQGYPPHTIETFHRGITWYAMARKTGKKTYKFEARKVKKEIAKWVEKGNPNVKDYGMLLSAEEAVLNKKYKKADDYYKQAIAHAISIGHNHHAALYNERFAEYQLEVHADQNSYQHHLTQAIRFYTDWGALGKAELLRRSMVDIAGA